MTPATITITVTLPVLLLAVIGWLITHTEHAERLASWVFGFFKGVSQFAERGHVASDIQANVNTFCSALNKDAPGAVPQKLKISWVQNESKEAFLRDGHVVVRLRHHPDQDRNLIAATHAFLGKALLSRTKPYLDPQLCRSIDLTATRRVLIDSHRPSALNLFHTDVLQPEVKEKPAILQDVQLLQGLDDSGFFTRVVLRELGYLGDRLYPSVPNPAANKEPRKLLEFLKTIATKARGDDVPLAFIEPRIKLGFVLVARAERAASFDSGPYVEAIKGHFRRGAGTVYLCGEGSNVGYVKAVSSRFLVTKEGAKEEHRYRVTNPNGSKYDAICVVLRPYESAPSSSPSA